MMAMIVVIFAVLVAVQAASVNTPVGKLLQLQREIDAAKQATAIKDFLLTLGPAGSSNAGQIESNSWPFNSKVGACEITSTRDEAVKVDNKASDGIFDQAKGCGINMYDADQSEKRTWENPLSRHVDRTTGLTNQRDELLRMLIDYVNGRFRPKPLKYNKHHHIVDQENEVAKDMESRVVGGEGAKAGEWPWLVAIGRKGNGLSCGGSIIHENWVLTAAHCFQEEEQPCSFNVRAGSLNWMQDSEGYHEDREPVLIIKHANFDPDTLENDIALIKLSRPFSLDKRGYINAVCLPVQTEDVRTGDTTVAAGWGTEEEDASSIPETARDVSLPVMARSECGFDITKKQLCAGYATGGKDTCQGDSGGPLMSYRDGRWFQVGITSYGSGCARAGWPGIYTEVSAYADYVASVIARHS